MIATQIGMDPLHFGLVFCLMLIIALVTPPVGMTLFVTANLAEVPVSKISKAIVPFIAAALLIIIFMAYMPGLSLLLPRVLLGYGK
jgi:TRAP-type C4-dicarboxylate transport system permease large subunit